MVALYSSILQIFVKLDPMDLGRCSYVSRLWQKMVREDILGRESIMRKRRRRCKATCTRAYVYP